MLSVAETVPAPVLDALGAAKGVGRDRWEDLKKIVQVPAKSAQALELVQSDAFAELKEGDRFGILVERLKISGARKPKKQPPAEKAWSLSGEAVKVSTRDSGKAFTLAVKAKDASQFGAYLSKRLERLYQEFQKNGEEGSD
jgi:ParB family chromosome partitioning protein